MSRINGIGTWLLGVEKTDQPGIYTATNWITVLFLPLIPLARHRIKPTRMQRGHMSYEILSKEKLNALEVLRTYLFGWILIPLLGFAPIVLAVAEVQSALGIPYNYQIILQLLVMVWIIVFVWKLKDWDENRWRA